MNPWIRKITALSAAVFFLLNETAGAALVRTQNASSYEVSVSQPFRVELPQVLGRVETLRAGTGPVIFHIQEAHGNVEGQKNITKILEYLNQNYGVEQVLLEGDAGKLQPEILNFYPNDSTQNEKQLEQLVEKGIVTGPEVFLVKDPKASGFGIEDPALYRENLRAFACVEKNRPQTEPVLKKLGQKIRNQIQKKLPRSLFDLLEAEEKYEKNILSFEVWIRTLSNAALQNLGLDLENARNQMEFPQLVRYFVLKRSEKTIDPKKAVSEKQIFIQELARLLGKEKTRAYEKELLSETSSGEKTLRWLEHLIRELPPDFPYGRFPNLNHQTGARILRSEMSGKELFHEMKLIRTRLIDDLAKTQEAGDALKIWEDYRLLLKLFALELTHEEHEIFKQRQTAIESDFRQFLSGKAAQLYQNSVRFYALARERDRVMAEKIHKHFEKTRARHAAVITGGFHSAPLAARLKEKNYTYVRVSPAMKTAEEKNAYASKLIKSMASDVFTMPASSLRAADISCSPAALRQLGSRRPVILSRGEVRANAVRPAAAGRGSGHGTNGSHSDEATASMEFSQEARLLHGSRLWCDARYYAKTALEIFPGNFFAWKELAEIASDLGEWDRLQIIAEDMFALPEGKSLLIRLGNVFISKCRFGAFRIVMKTIQKPIEIAKSFLRVSEKQGHDRKPDFVLAAIETDPDFLPAWQAWLEWIQKNQEAPNKMIQEMIKFYNNGATKAKVLTAFANTFLKSEKINPALLLAAAVFEKNPLDVVNSAFYMKVLIRDQKPDRALEIGESLREREIKDAYIEAEIAYALMALERYEEAVEHGRKASEQFPDNGPIRNALFRALMRCGEFESALELARRYQTDPLLRVAYLNERQLALRNPSLEFDLKLEKFDQIFPPTRVRNRIRYSPQRKEVRELPEQSKEFQNLVRSRKIPEAEKLAKQMIQDFPNRSYGYTSLMKILIMCKNFVQAVNVGELALKEGDFNARDRCWVSNVLVDAYLQARLLEKAVELAEDTARRAPENVSVQNTLIGVYRRLERFDEAFAIGDRVLKDPSIPNKDKAVTHGVLARIYYEQKNYRKILELLNLETKPWLGNNFSIFVHLFKARRNMGEIRKAVEILNLAQQVFWHDQARFQEIHSLRQTLSRAETRQKGKNPNKPFWTGSHRPQALKGKAGIGALVDRVYDLLRRGKAHHDYVLLNEAVKIGKQVVAQYPERPEGYDALLGVYRYRKWFRDTEALARFALDHIQAPEKRSFYYSVLANAMSALGRRDESLEVCRKAVAEFPEDPVLYTDYLKTLFNRGDIREAVRRAKQEIEGNHLGLQRDPVFHAFYITLLLETGQDAIAEQHTAWMLLPGNFRHHKDAWTSCLRVLMRMEAWDEMCEVGMEAMEYLDEADRHIYSLTALALTKLKHARAVKQLTSEAMRKFWWDPYIILNRMEALLLPDFSVYPEDLPREVIAARYLHHGELPAGWDNKILSPLRKRAEAGENPDKKEWAEALNSMLLQKLNISFYRYAFNSQRIVKSLGRRLKELLTRAVRPNAHGLMIEEREWQELNRKLLEAVFPEHIRSSDEMRRAAIAEAKQLGSSTLQKPRYAYNPKLTAVFLKVLLEAGDFVQAVQTAERAVQSFPRDPVLATLYVKTLVHAGRSGEAVSFCEQEKYDTWRAQDSFFIAAYEQALQALEESRKIAALPFTWPQGKEKLNDPGIYESSLERLWSQTQYDLLVQAGYQALQRFPQNAMIRVWLACGLIRKQMPETAIKLLDLNIQTLKEKPEVYLVLAEAYEAAGDPQAADGVFDTAMYLFSGDQEVFTRIQEARADFDRRQTRNTEEYDDAFRQRAELRSDGPASFGGVDVVLQVISKYFMICLKPFSYYRSSNEKDYQRFFGRSEADTVFEAMPAGLQAVMQEGVFVRGTKVGTHGQIVDASYTGIPNPEDVAPVLLYLVTHPGMKYEMRLPVDASEIQKFIQELGEFSKSKLGLDLTKMLEKQFQVRTLTDLVLFSNKTPTAVLGQGEWLDHIGTSRHVVKIRTLMHRPDLVLWAAESLDQLLIHYLQIHEEQEFAASSMASTITASIQALQRFLIAA